MDKLQTTIYGMTLDQVFFQRKPGVLSYAMNANIQSKDGRGITYTNEYSNQLCVTFPQGFIVIGTKLVLSKNEIIFALVNPTTGESEIGKVTNFSCNNLTAENVEYDCTNCRGKQLISTVTSIKECCKYEKIINANCLNFHINYPVRMIYKITNCGYKLYFTDNYNEPRYINLDDYLNGDYIAKDDCNDPIEFDCERIKIFKDFCIPDIQAVSEEGGGNLQAGVYQATLAYCDVNGQEYTEYFDHTNPVPVFERTITNDTDYITAKSIKYSITHNTDIFEYFKVVIIKTVNETSDYLEAGIFRVTPTNNITFGENDKSLIDSDINRITTPKPDYTKAKLIEESGNYLLLCDLEDSPEYNFQLFANQMKLYWETVNMPYDSNNNYSNPIVVSRFRGYMRDEVYPFAIRFKLKNGKRTKAFHIPNRLSTPFDLDPISNDDVISDENCTPIQQKPRWKVYNTASNPCDGSPCCDYTDKYPQTTFPDKKICDITRACYGDFAYWESTETYPCDERVWGDLAGQPIRFHKFPDSLINHIHDSFLSHPANPGYDINHKSTVYPIGIRLDESIFNDLINRTLIYDPKTGKTNIPMSELVCGFEIVRGNRVGNKSIIAKGLLYDVGRVNERAGEGLNLNAIDVRTYYMPNYPYNDIRPNDPYLSKNAAIYKSPDPNGTIETDYRLSSYPTNWAQRTANDFRRFTFHGPDIHFQKPALGTNLKIETEEYGLSQGHFVQVQDHPRYKFLTKFDMTIATTLGALGGYKIGTEEETEIDGSTTVGVRERGKSKLDFNYSDFINTSNLVRDIFEKSIPKRNFAYAYHSRGVYNNYKPIPNDGGKIRSLDIAKYLSPNNQNLGDDASVFNYGRESSVYLKVNQAYRDYTLPEYSRYTLSSSNYSDHCKNPEYVQSEPIRSFYSAVRREIPDQYGRIENLNYISTGYSVTLVAGQFVQTYYPIFGGDTFINRFALKRKMPFFTQNMVGRPDEIDFDYNLVPNFAFPTYYIGTSPDELELKNVINGVDFALIIAGIGALITAQTVPPVIIPPAVPSAAGVPAKLANIAAMALLTAGGVDIYRKILGGFIPKNNLDCDTTPANFDPTNPSSWNFGDYTLFYQSGKFYLTSYGIPNFFVESDVNVEYRYGRNEKEENFYPNVGNDIPDNWLQEKNVPILFDNFYSYNATYSIQNYQQLIQPYIGRFFDKPCQSSFPNRVIYSEKANNEELSDNWLKFGSDNYYDFEKANGDIVGINGLDNNRLMVRFENNFQLWNTRITLPSSSPLQVSMANSGMFTQDPLEFTRTYLGHGGSQHYAFEQTRVGNFWVDAKRGVVFRFTSQLDEISQPNYNWFKENLPFNIIKSVPNVNIDNAFNNIGLSICWDERFQRLFITKKDYDIVPEYKGQIFWENGNFFWNDLDTVRLIDVSDTTFFINKSFTIAWSPIINNWVSFYSFLPNYYISLTDHFQTGVHNGVQSTLWNHGLSNLSYQIYYNKLYPYILEIPISNIPQSEILKSVTVHTDIMKYTSETDFYSIKSINKENYNIFFTKAIIYNKEQCTGTLNLVETPINNLQLKSQYPIFNTDSIDVLYAKYDKVCTFNTFFDAVRDHGSGQPIFTNDWTSIQPQYPIDKVLNTNNLRYSSRYMKQPIKSNECYVRLIQDVHSRYKFVNTFDIMQQENKNQ